MKKYWRFIFYFLLVWVLVITQIGFINSLPYGWNRIDLIIWGLILFLFFFDYKVTLGLALGMGFLLDIFSFEFFGIYLLTLFLTVLISEFLLNNFFTNRSTYSFLALTFFTTLFYNFTFYLLVYVGRFLEDKAFFLFTANFWLGLSLEIIWSSVFVWFFFMVMNLTTNRLKPVFLDKK